MKFEKLYQYITYFSNKEENYGYVQNRKAYYDYKLLDFIDDFKDYDLLNRDYDSVIGTLCYDQEGYFSYEKVREDLSLLKVEELTAFISGILIEDELVKGYLIEASKNGFMAEILKMLKGKDL